MTINPHRIGLCLIAPVLGYFVCGFVAQRVLADEIPPGRFVDTPPTFLDSIKEPGNVSGSITITPEQVKKWTFDVDKSLSTKLLRIDPIQNVTIKSGYVRTVKVGDAVLTKKSVRILINTLELANVICRWQQEDMEKRSAEFPSNILAKENIATVAKTRDDIKRQISELQNLADALAEERAK